MEGQSRSSEGLKSNLFCHCLGIFTFIIFDIDLIVATREADVRIELPYTICESPLIEIVKLSFHSLSINWKFVYMTMIMRK